MYNYYYHNIFDFHPELIFILFYTLLGYQLLKTKGNIITTII